MDSAACPFCVEPNFGVIYYSPKSPEYRAKYGDIASLSDAMSVRSVPTSETTNGEKSGVEADESGYLSPGPQSPVTGRRRSLSHKSPGVVTTDEIRPDGVRKQQQLALARAVNQRRVVHPLAGVPRRNRTTFNTSNMDADTQRELASAAAAAATLVEGLSNAAGEGSGRRAGRRVPRNAGELAFGYMDAVRGMGADLEELMIMEAVRRSLMESTAQTSNETTAESGGSTTGSASSPQASASDSSPASATSGAGPASSETPSTNSPPPATVTDVVIPPAEERKTPVGAGEEGINVSAVPVENGGHE
ncbi:SNF1-interacting protein [Rhizophlyctis rosea]|nr:SNF1-interacting protein [Rhizophlyctis rosea]